jgi:Flp pilus assembly secretin CpaC
MKRFILLLVLFSGLCTSVYAADELALNPKPSDALPAKKEKEEQSLVLAVDKAEKITIPEAADTVFVASPAIADVQVVSPTNIMVYGRSPGETTLTATRKDGSVILQRRVIVDKDLGKLQDVLGNMLPKIRALPVPGGIVLSGEAESSAQAADAQRIAKRFIAKEKDSEVINRLKVVGSEQIQFRSRRGSRFHRRGRRVQPRWRQQFPQFFISKRPIQHQWDD